ncbi:helix-turn-helix domain-containing protein [Proteiniphilum propionicum]|jgi:transcriptional regulator with XRE-family HTH domain|uniref:helix-turn-helix domain-containing protein n=1 Tax=Proteiniphilum propionicum TaxID=2829812 RepID=UPI001EEAB8F9|nr:helix-turn-helix transcriptional regulator [Proteiniphilum propionicum]ULB35635.1 helix-turn-helix transcriptional regulator [Proteiniphilum propionicum]
MADLRVKDIIKEKGLTMQEVSDRIGIVRDTLTRQINGNPTVETLQRIADALEVTVPELFTSQSSSDFTALIDYKGELKRFNSVDELKRFLDSIDQ